MQSTQTVQFVFLKKQNFLKKLKLNMRDTLVLHDISIYDFKNPKSILPKTKIFQNGILDNN